MFDRMTRSYELGLSSWRVLAADKQLILFPIVSAIASFMVLITFVAPFVLNPQWLQAFHVQDGHGAHAQGHVQVPIWVWGVLFVYYFCTYFVVVFCNAALISCALVRFNGGTPSLVDGFRMAAARAPQIAAWCLVSATVGVLLKMIESANEKAGEFISGLLGLAWSVLTFFVVPVLVVENVGPFEAVSRSVALLRKSWGTALVSRMGLGLFLFLAVLPVVALFVISFLLLANPATQVLGLVMLGVSALALVVYLAVSSALQGIFLGVLYQYATTQEAPIGFDSATLAGAFGNTR